VGRPEGKKPLGIPKCRWEGMDWIELAQGRDRKQAHMNVVIQLRVT
jgi:hypothetical protein